MKVEMKRRLTQMCPTLQIAKKEGWKKKQKDKVKETDEEK
jgi:hypothetical protein